jgi:hypothetical protein
MGNTTNEVDPATLSDDDLMAEWTALGDEVQAMRERLNLFSEEHQRRTRKAQLAAQVGAVSDEDLALLQEIQAEGVESEEAVQTGDREGDL